MLTKSSPSSSFPPLVLAVLGRSPRRWHQGRARLRPHQTGVSRWAWPALGPAWDFPPAGASGLGDGGSRGREAWGLPLRVVLGWVNAWPGSPCGLRRGLLSKGDPSPQNRAFALQFLLEELLGLKPSQSCFSIPDEGQGLPHPRVGTGGITSGVVRAEAQGEGTGAGRDVHCVEVSALQYFHCLSIPLLMRFHILFELVGIVPCSVHGSAFVYFGFHLPLTGPFIKLPSVLLKFPVVFSCSEYSM